jgi:hypothetical protein
MGKNFILKVATTLSDGGVDIKSFNSEVNELILRDSTGEEYVLIKKSNLPVTIIPRIQAPVLQPTQTAAPITRNTNGRFVINGQLVRYTKKRVINGINVELTANGRTTYNSNGKRGGTNGITLLAGSMILVHHSKNMGDNIIEIKNELLNVGWLKLCQNNNLVYILDNDVYFDKISSATTLINGQRMDGYRAKVMYKPDNWQCV